MDEFEKILQKDSMNISELQLSQISMREKPVSHKDNNDS
jgi:hypothetical protein